MSKPAGSRLGLLKGEEEHRAAASLLGKRALAGFAGILQVDGYAAYNRLTSVQDAGQFSVRSLLVAGVKKPTQKAEVAYCAQDSQPGA